MAKRKSAVEPLADIPDIEALPENLARPIEGRLSRRRWHVDEMPDKGLFAIIAFVGFAMIVAAKILTDWPSWVVAILAAAVMFSYLIVAVRIPKLVLRLDRLGDNFYYLGFVFTLASLSAALMQIQNSQSVVKAVLGSFGIALMTTIIGVTGRVVLVQMRGELDEVEEDTRRSLVERSETLKDELGSLITDFSILRTSISQLVREVTKVSTKTFDTRFDYVAKAAESATRRLDESFESQLRNIGGIEVAFERMHSLAGDASIRLAGALQTNTTAISEVSQEAISAIRSAAELQDSVQLKIAESFKISLETAKAIAGQLEQTQSIGSKLASQIGVMQSTIEQGISEIKTTIEKQPHPVPMTRNPFLFWRPKEVAE